MSHTASIVFIICSIFLAKTEFAQGIENLNKFKIINIHPLKYNVVGKNGKSNIVFDLYGIHKTLKQTLNSSGIQTTEFDEFASDFKRDDCEIGYCFIEQKSNLDPNTFDEIVIHFTDCNYTSVYECGAKLKSLVAAKAMASVPLAIGTMQEATRAALTDFKDYTHSHNPHNPIVKNATPICHLNKSEIKDYLKSETDKLDPIEGIYTSLDVDFYYIKIAIIKKENWFDLVILESENPLWQIGQIRGKIEPKNNETYSGLWNYSANDNYELIIDNSKTNKVKIFRFLDSINHEYFEIEFKKKLP